MQGQRPSSPPALPAAPSSRQDTQPSRSLLASAAEIQAAPTKAVGVSALTPRATAKPYSEVMKHPKVSNYATLAKQDEKLTRSDPIILGCKRTSPLLQTGDLDSTA